MKPFCPLAFPWQPPELHEAFVKIGTMSFVKFSGRGDSAANPGAASDMAARTVVVIAFMWRGFELQTYASSRGVPSHPGKAGERPGSGKAGKEKKAVEPPVWLAYHTAMKMTMHIDESVLAEVMDITGDKTKTGAVETALKEMARKSKLKKLLRAGMGMTSDEIKASYDFSTYDRLNSDSELRVAEKSKVTYGSKARSRR